MEKKIIILLLFFSSHYLFAFQGESTRLYEDGMKRLNAGDSLLAETLLTQYLKETSKNEIVSEAKLGLGIAFVKNKKANRAVDLFGKLNAWNEDDLFQERYYYWFGVASYSLGRWNTARHLFEKYLEFPRVIALINSKMIKPLQNRSETDLIYQAWTYLAWANYRANNHQDAFNILEGGYKSGLQPQFSSSLFSLSAILAFEFEKYDWFKIILNKIKYAKIDDDFRFKFKMYEAQFIARTKGDLEALPFFEKLNLSEQDWNDELVQYGWMNLFNLYDAGKNIDKLSACALAVKDAASSCDEVDNNKRQKSGGALNKKKPGCGDLNVRKMLLRAAWLELGRGNPDKAIELTDCLADINPKDAVMWNYRMDAILLKNAKEQLEFPDFKVPSINEILPQELVLSITDPKNEKGIKGGDYIWIKLLIEMARESKWAQCEREALHFLNCYPSSQWYFQSLYLAVRSSIKQDKLNNALEILKQDAFYQKKLRIKKDFSMEEIEILALEAWLLRQQKDYWQAMDRYDLILSDTKGYFDNDMILNSALTSFQLLIYQKVHVLTDLIEKRNQQSEKGSEVDIRLLLGRYLKGLSYIAVKEYAPALTVLETIDSTQLINYGFASVVPWLNYYLGWCYYRLGKYDQAEKLFSQLALNLKEHPLNLKSKKLAGWAALSDGNNKNAASHFKEVAEETTGEDQEYALFLYGKTMAKQKDPANKKEGIRVLTQLVKKKNSPFVDDSLMALGEVYEEDGNAQKASDCYLAVGRNCPASKMVEEADYLAAESLFRGGFYSKAADFYNRYRQLHSKGFNYEAALFYGAVSMKKAGDTMGAFFIFQLLLEAYPKGPYYADAIINIAEIYTAKRDWAKASQLYHQLQNDFPDEARAIRVSKRLNTLFFKAQGADSREAELLVFLQKSNNPEYSKSRSAMLELAEIYINLESDDKRRKKALGWLNEIKKMSSRDREDSALAWRLVGDDSYRMGDFHDAVNGYLKAAALSRKKDFSAGAMYRAVTAALDSGSSEDVLSIVKSMEKKYPNSKWLKKCLALTRVQQILKEKNSE